MAEKAKIPAEVDTSLEGPYECPSCEGHMMLDATFLEQVSTMITCPYCQTPIEIPE